MKKAIIGAGGFAREIACCIDEEITFFVSDVLIDKFPNAVALSKFDHNEYFAIIAIGDPTTRKKFVESMPKETRYFNFIHHSAQILDSNIEIGEGTIICANSILTTNIKLGKHCHLNLATTIGHDTTIGDYLTTSPGTHISGNCQIESCVYLGTNSSIKEKIKINKNSKIGLNSGVVKDIKEEGVFVGTPCKRIK